ncbi:unnamed protein product [Rhizoctonia solani]|uniref:Uncharacterized protein n=1 Tax=Rhizoctonia solani TaxID=456999 RepID=A0A8H3AH69_9AGAM|nr:unnamed protein product [Rhizoctonia solani]CAE6523065.1 unnamed protein product [Rhizoctonia solani]
MKFMSDTPVAKAKPKAPAWIASEFQAQASPSKPHVRPPPPRPKDPSTIRVATKPTFQFTDLNVPLDPQPKKQISAKPFSVQPAPPFLPKAFKEKSAHRTLDPALFHIQTPVFQTSIQPCTAPDGFTTRKEVLPMPPPPRIEPKAIAVPETPADFTEREYVPLTYLATPRVFENTNAISGKGKERTVSSDSDIPISDDPAVGDSMLATEGETDMFGMNDLSLGLDRDTSHVGHSGDSGRKAASKFIKGGLAARALMVITQRAKDDALWHHYQTAKSSKNSNSRADLRVHVVQVLQRVSDSLLVRCTLPLGESISAIGNLAGDIGTLLDPILVDVLFSQPGTRGLPAIEPSAVIRLWKPWIQINFDDASRPLPISPVGEVNDKHPAITAVDASVDNTRERSQDVPRHPEPPSSYSEIFAPDRRAQYALLCSRFVVG